MKEYQLHRSCYLPRLLNRLVVTGLFLPIAFILVGCASQKIAHMDLPNARPVIYAGNYSSIQLAINALPDEGGMVRLPPGNFHINEAIRIDKSDVYLQGAGPATHIINDNKNQQPALLLAADTAVTGKEQEQLWRIQISDLRITGNENSGSGILARDINEILISRVTISQHGKDGIRLDHCYENPRINNCSMTYNKEVGLNLIGCHDIVVTGNEFEENEDALHCTDGFNLTMSGNNLDDHLSHGVVIENTYGSVVSGNMIEECRGTAVILDRDCYGINIGGNVIAHNNIGVDMKDAHGIAVSANTFTINQEHGVLIRAGSGSITISGNNFSDSYIGEEKVKREEEDRNAGGLTLLGCENVLISGNVFSGIHPGKALTVQDAPKNVMFRDNMIFDSESDHLKLDDSFLESNLKIDRR